MGRRTRLHPVNAAAVLRSVPPETSRRFREAFRRLADDPTGISVGLDVKVLETDENMPRMFRVRLGDWRAAFTLEADAVIVLRVFHRSEGYGWLERRGY